MTRPVFKILEGPSPTDKGVSQAATAGLATALSAASKAAELFPHDVEGLLQILHFRNQIAKSSNRRSRWIGGRLFNRLSGEDPEYIPISGTHLQQTLSAVSIETPDFVVASGKYQLRLDISEEAVKVLVDTQVTHAK
jgi:hypothetical protein